MNIHLEGRAVSSPTRIEDVANALRKRYGQRAEVVLWPPILKMRQGLNRGANIRLLLECQPTKIEAAPRTYMDDNASRIIKLVGAGCAFLGLGMGTAEMTAEKAASMWQSGIGMCLLFTVIAGAIGSIAAVIGTTIIAGKSQLDENRQWTRNLEVWLNQTLCK